MINIAKIFIFLWWVFSVTPLCYAQPLMNIHPENFRWGDFGDTVIYPGGTHNVQLILTDQEHHSQAAAYANQLGQQGNLSAVLNIDNYLAGITQQHAKCFDAATPLSVYAQDIEQRHQLHHYIQPFITGFGSAGGYVFAMLSSIPKGIFRGAYSIDWRHNIYLPVAPCRNNNSSSWNIHQQQLILNSTILPATPWKLFNTHPLIAQWLPDYPILKNWQVDEKTFELSINNLGNTKERKRIEHLPLIEIPAQNNNDNQDVLAFVISGDGGWANIDKDIANQLAQKGIAVVGWNALEYFWEEKSENRIGKDFQTAIDYYTTEWNKRRLLLIGFSMGADVMPFMVNQLNNETKTKIISVNLLNPSTSVDFVFHVNGWLGSSHEAEHFLYPAMKNWNKWPTRCFYSEKNQSLCEEIQKNNDQKPDKQELIYLPGDHHFNGDYQKLIRIILEKIKS